MNISSGLFFSKEEDTDSQTKCDVPLTEPKTTGGRWDLIVGLVVSKIHLF